MAADQGSIITQNRRAIHTSLVCTPEWPACKRVVECADTRTLLAAITMRLKYHADGFFGGGKKT
jgi:hypothetical protein